MTRTWATIIALSIFTMTEIQGARILAFFPTPSISHQVIFSYVTKELARRGHEVISITTDPLPKGQAPANLTEIDVHDISYKNWEDLFLLHTGNKQNLMDQVLMIIKKSATTVNLQMNAPAVRQVLMNKDRKYFDLLLVEAINQPILGLGHIFDAPIVQISSLGAFPQQYNIFGAPMNPFLYTTPVNQRLYNLTLWEKTMELVRLLKMQYLLSSGKDFVRNVMQNTFGNDVPSVVALHKKISLLLLNEHPIWVDNRPVPTNIIYIGGIHQREDRPLPRDLKYYLDSSKRGVIYVSFGTNVLTTLLPPEKIRIMTKVFSELPYDVLWKWDGGELPGKSNNTVTSRWFPQSDLLKHPNIKLFVTQGGLQSTDETINAAVPVIGIPMLGDQWYNTEKYVRHRIGLQLDLLSLTEDKFKAAVITTIEDKSYKKNIVRLRSLMREFPVKPLDNAIWWIEHVIKYGGEHLRSPSSGLSFAEYYEINLVLVILLVLSVILILVCYIMKLVLRFVVNLYVLNEKLKTC